MFLYEDSGFYHEIIKENHFPIHKFQSIILNLEDAQ